MTNKTHQVDGDQSECVVPEIIHTPHGRSLKISEGGRGPEAEIPKGYEVRRVIIFQGVQEHCSRETYQDRICNLVNQQIHELQYTSVYATAIRTFRGHSRGA